MISYFDYQVGLIVQELKKQGIYENTIIMVTSDNGPQSTSAGWFNSASPFRSETGYVKGTVYEGGIRVPLIVSWPDKIKNQQVSDHICAAWDIFPYIM
jgi:arylsulfatase A-like enzyme